MSKNNNLSSLDVVQMQRQMYDEGNEAQRVILVGSDFSSVTTELKNSISEALKDFKLPEVQVQSIANSQTEPIIVTEKEIEYREIDRPYIVKETEIEYREIEKPYIVKETIIKTIEVPYIVKEIEYREIDKPVYIEKQLPLPNWVKLCLVSQTIVLLFSIIINFLK